MQLAVGRDGVSVPCSLLHSFPAAPLSSTQTQRLHPALSPGWAGGTGSCAAELAANTRPSPENTGTRGQRALGGTRVSWGAVTPCRAGTATLPPGAFIITSPLPLGCCSLLSNLLAEAKLGACQGCSAGRCVRLQAGQERGQALQPGTRAFPKLQGHPELQVPLPGVNQQHPEALWGQSGALGSGQALGLAPCCAGSHGEQSPSSPKAGRAPTGLRDTGMGTAGAWGRVTAPKKCPEAVSQPCCPVEANTFEASKETCRDGREEPGAGLSQQEWLEGIPAWNHCLSAPHTMPCVSAGGWHGLVLCPQGSTER